nr:hypothetical protein [Beduini massiliensis]
MKSMTIRKVNEAESVISSTIKNCEKMQLKFNEGSSQHTLLKNRIKALYIAKALVKQEDLSLYTTKELCQALPPITSIIHKCEKGQSKFEKETPYYQRFVPLINAMSLSLKLLNEEINKRA